MCNIWVVFFVCRVSSPSIYTPASVSCWCRSNNWFLQPKLNFPLNDSTNHSLVGSMSMYCKYSFLETAHKSLFRFYVKWVSNANLKKKYIKNDSAIKHWICVDNTVHCSKLTSARRSNNHQHERRLFKIVSNAFSWIPIINSCLSRTPSFLFFYWMEFLNLFPFPFPKLKWC